MPDRMRPDTALVHSEPRDELDGIVDAVLELEAAETFVRLAVDQLCDAFWSGDPRRIADARRWLSYYVKLARRAAHRAAA